VSVGLGLPLRRSMTVRPESETGLAGGARRLLRAPGLFRALLASSVVLAAVDISLAYFPALGQERGYSATIISALLVVRAAASMVSRLLLGRLAARIGRRRLLFSCVVGSAATFVALAVPLPPPLLVLQRHFSGVPVRSRDP
jgi:predicted MFS family arabinose efflux permease